MDTPRVSILIPVHERAAMLLEAARSALCQEFRDFELVIVDNHSTDATWEACERLAREHPATVRVFRNSSNVGPVLNWKRCLDEARGELAHFLFSDDLVAPDFLSRLVRWMERDDVAFVFSQARIGTDPSAGELAWRWRAASGVYPSVDFQRSLLLGASEVPVSPVCALFRTADLRERITGRLPTGLDFSDHGGGADAMLYLLTSRTRPNVAHVAEPLCFLRAHPGSTTIQGRAGRVRDSYFETFLWFAADEARMDWLARLQSKVWLHEMWRARRWLDAGEALARFRSPARPRAQLWARLPAEALRLLAHRVRSHGFRKRRRHALSQLGPS
jgi:glycosyltransferase involved in cell wall biosynthesis